MISERSFGIIPVYNNQVLLVKHGKGHWALPKGHAEKGEKPDETAKRELAEEAGITDVELDTSKKFQEHYFFKQDGELVNKTVTYFIGRAKSNEVKVQPEEIDDYKWLSFKEAIELATFPATKRVLEEARVYLNN